jgi:hypothetical protein
MEAQDSLPRLVSSMVISLNSLDSKMSPHSMHSTNSLSSSRATICTRGCLHVAMLLLFSRGDGGIGFINPGGHSSPSGPGGEITRSWRYCSLTFWLVKSPKQNRSYQGSWGRQAPAHDRNDGRFLEARKRVKMEIRPKQSDYCKPFKYMTLPFSGQFRPLPAGGCIEGPSPSRIPISD